MWLSGVPKAQSWETEDVQERRTATPSEAILAVSRLLGELAASETPEAVRAALVRAARAPFAVDDALLLAPDALPAGEDLAERADRDSGSRSLLVGIRQDD